ncbi:hypothetical protein TEQG_04726 [Trichophyton equinum CBS 127.97]|uniref:Uncharacterized protein n=1 Tax=Trichophyton equinum (strain ATCC MYA-4606 / CBS 127.97) TaxID=559882 RepID=F2PV00_TRIEC|nr:hypothetical protein TEQG_04726 [Trichophyton equinum CBS 127.97]
MVAEPIVVVGGRGRKKEAWREWKKAKWPKSHWPEVANSRVRSGVGQARPHPQYRNIIHGGHGAFSVMQQSGGGILGQSMIKGLVFHPLSLPHVLELSLGFCWVGPCTVHENDRQVHPPKPSVLPRHALLPNVGKPNGDRRSAQRPDQRSLSVRRRESGAGVIVARREIRHNF